MPERKFTELIARLPRTFRPAVNDQFRQWDLLFPAEQRQLEAQLGWLAGLAREDFDRLFAPIVALESRMELPRWEPGAAGLTVEDVGILARSPLYPQWRAEVEKVFSRIDEEVLRSGAAKPLPRLVLGVLPSGLPLPTTPLWSELQRNGAWITLDQPFGRILTSFVPELAGRKLAAGTEEIESTWVFACDDRLSPPAAVTLTWTGLAAARREFLSRLNTVRRNLKSVDQTHEELRRLDMGKLLPSALGGNPRVREFVRGIMLSGNGSLVFNNSFVQWGATEAMRRVQPQVLVAAFGIRPRLKPFSGSVLFEDQRRANPVEDAEDPAGSLVDALKLAEYVYLAEGRTPAYQERTLTLLAASDLDRLLVIGAKMKEKMSGAELTAHALQWLAP